MKQHSRDCMKFWRRGDHQSILKHLEVNTQKVFIMIWVEYLQEMLHLIITNWLNWNGVWIWNGFRVKFNRKLWRVNININIINSIMTGSPHYSWNHRAVVGRRGPVFEVSLWRLTVPLYWWFIWFFNMKYVALIIFSSKTWWEEFMAMDDACISLVSNPSTAFSNNVLYHADIWNKFLEIYCIIVDGRLRNKMTRSLTCHLGFNEWYEFITLVNELMY